MCLHWAFYVNFWESEFKFSSLHHTDLINEPSSHLLTCVNVNRYNGDQMWSSRRRALSGSMQAASVTSYPAARCWHSWGTMTLLRTAEAEALSLLAQLLWFLHSSLKSCGVNGKGHGTSLAAQGAGCRKMTISLQNDHLVVSVVRMLTWFLSFKGTSRNNLDERESELCNLSRHNNNTQGCLSQ